MLITPDAGGTDESDLVFTPGIAAMLEDRGFFGGLRYQKSFDDGFSGISGWYWDLSLGYGWDFSDELALEFVVSYPFEDFDEFSEFDDGDLEYGLGLTFNL